MVTRNIVIGGMTGGAGHVGIATQGYGGALSTIISVSVYLTPNEVETGLTDTEIESKLTLKDVVVRLR